MAKILVADDAAFMRMRLSSILREIGHEVVEAENGQEAVEKYFADKPHLVLMDITMPEMDGIAAIEAIRSRDPAARVVVCSAMGQQSMVVRAIKAGARDFIVNPFEPERVKSAVAKSLGA